MIEHEVDFEERCEVAKKVAWRVFNGVGETEEEHEFFFRMILSEHYNIPMFSDFFLNLTLDQLIFEVEMVRLRTQTKEDRVTDMATRPESQEEISGLFDDLQEGDEKVDENWEEASIEDTSDVDEAMQNFMDTGKFQGE